MESAIDRAKQRVREQFQGSMMSTDSIIDVVAAFTVYYGEERRADAERAGILPPLPALIEGE